MKTKQLTARYAGHCQCGAHVNRGDTIQYQRGRGITGCQSCSGGTPDYHDMAMEDMMAEAAGVGDNSPWR